MSDRTMEQLFHILKEGRSPFHVVREACAQLTAAGFALLEDGAWDLQPGGRYAYVHHGSTLFAFSVGKNYKPGAPCRIAAAHTDFPCLRIKPNADMQAGGYAQLNVEVYGGAILNTWLDRPLTVAGRVALLGDELMKPRMRLFAAEEPVLTIPNLAIHMNREVNKGLELNKQTDLLPVAAMAAGDGDGGQAFLHYLAGQLGVEETDILDYELSVVNAEEPCYTGLSQEFVSAPRLDNLTSVQALLSGMLAAEGADTLNVIALFDHEEVGSRTKQGAGSLLLRDLLAHIQCALGVPGQLRWRCLYDSMLLSVDVAHALHPNKISKADLTNKPVLNGGVCIKEASAQSYATDSEAVAIVQQICKAYQIPYQKFANRSDQPGGGTLGSIASSLLPVRTVDIGIPLLAMHSARELMGRSDQESLERLVKAYFTQ